MFAFLTPYMTYIKIGIAAIVILGIAWLYGEMSHYKAEVAVLTVQLGVCQEANKTTLATNESLRQERDRAGTECETMLSIKDEEIAKYKKMLSAKGDIANEKPNLVSSGDNVLDLLNGVSPAKAGNAGGVCTGEDGKITAPGAGLGSRVLLRRYCFSTKQDAINWLINNAAHDASEKLCRSIVESHQTTTTQ
jgi:hypothetical protein